MPRVAVVGGGIAGLASGVYLRDRARELQIDLDVVVLEAVERPGGNIRTERTDGWVIEWGPNGYLDSVPATSALARRVGLGDHIRPADAKAAKRYLYRNGRLHLLPTGPLAFLRSPVLSPAGRVRVLLEPFAHPKPHGVDETIEEFASRRIGREAASVLIDAMVSGVFAGDIRALSLESTFPKMAAMEAEHGGLVRAMIARMRERRTARKQAQALNARGESAEALTQPGGPAGPAGTLTSFDGGLDRFPAAIAEHLGDALRLGVTVEAVERGPADGWRLRCSDATTVEADAVLLTVPAARAAALLRPNDTPLADLLSGITSAGLAVVALGYDAATLGGAPDGFGFLIPRGEGLRTLGCLWDSSLFPGRAPDGAVLLRAMIGGAHDPEAVSLDDDELLSIVRGDLARTMGIAADPILTRVYRHRGGIAQYVVGHADRLAGIQRHLRTLPGLWLAGSSYDGVAMNACIERAVENADRIVRWLAGRTTAAPALMTG